MDDRAGSRPPLRFKWIFHFLIVNRFVWINGTVGVGGCPPGHVETRQFNPIGGPSSRSLSAMIAQFPATEAPAGPPGRSGGKATTTRKINALNGVFGQQIWQRGYHDRIIRNEVELDKVCKYIRNNPRKVK